MPADTHQRREELSVAEISDLFAAILGLPEVAGEVQRVPLAEVGGDEDLVLFDLWDAAVEEYGERTIGEADLDDLRAVTTLGELAGLIASRCRATGDNVLGNDRGDAP